MLYDPEIVSYKELISSYLKSFRPSRSSKNDTYQYRAAIFYHDDEQKKIAEEVLSEISLNTNLLEPAKIFYPAEEYHQDYYNKVSFGMFR